MTTTFDIAPRSSEQLPDSSDHPGPRESAPEAHGIPDHTATRRSIRDMVNRRERGEETTGPRSRRTKKQAKPTPAMPRNLGKQVAEMYVLAGMAVMPFDQGCASVVVSSAERCGEAWEELAKVNPAVRRVLVGLTQTSAIGAVILAHAGIATAVGIHHIPAVRRMFAERAQAEQAEPDVVMPQTPDQQAPGEDQAAA
jgi:hypothetical protein